MATAFLQKCGVSFTFPICSANMETFTQRMGTERDLISNRCLFAVEPLIFIHYYYVPEIKNNAKVITIMAKFKSWLLIVQEDNIVNFSPGVAFSIGNNISFFPLPSDLFSKKGISIQFRSCFPL